MITNNEQKAKKITDRIFESGFNTNRTFYDMAKNAAMEMAKLKDEQIKAIAEIVADIFGSPFEYSPLDEDMLENEVCENCCNGSGCNDALCWMKYFEMKYKNKMTNNDRQE